MCEMIDQAPADMKKAWVTLSLALGPRSHLLKPLHRAFGDPAAILRADRAALLAACPDMGFGILSALADRRFSNEAGRILSWCRQNHVDVLTPADPGYPGSLFDIAEPPAVLYCKGLPLPLDRPAVGVVGTRHMDAYGERVAYKLSFELAAAGVVVISGMAAGVDGIAAAAALDAGGHTVAVLGCGIDIAYPKQHDRLMREICEFGTVVTEYAPGSRPNGWHFPARNRIISALSAGLVVTEADETSGALITARYALLQGKPLFAVPGDIDRPRSYGTNALIRAGAIPVLSAEDVLSQFRFIYRDAVGMVLPPEATQFTDVTDAKLRAHGMRSVAEASPEESGETPASAVRFAKHRRRAAERSVDAADQTSAASLEDPAEMLEPHARELYVRLPDAPFSVDSIVALGVPVSEAVSMLTMFEMYGLVNARPGGIYQKNH